MIWATILMALREIRRNTMRSVLTTLGIVIGVGSVIAMVTLGRGASARITADIANMGTNLVIVSPGTERRGPTSGSAKPFDLDDVRAIEREVSAASRVAPAAGRAALLVYGNKNHNATITGTTNDYLEVRGFGIALGQSFSDAQLQAGTPVCLLGATVRKELFGPQDPIGATVRVGTVPCTVVGVLTSKGQSTFGMDQDDFLVMPLRAFHRRIAGNNDVATIFVSAVSDTATSKAKQQIELLMRERRHMAPGQQNDFAVQDMKEISNTLGSVTGALTALLGAIAGVSLLVGGIGIMNIMLVSVTERTREIGLRLAIGARGAEVLLQFLIEAVTLSLLGGAIGVVFGLALSYSAARALTLPFIVLPDIVVVAFAFSATVGVAFGFLPARKASRLDPIEALRHE
ncbi:MAG: ABC transporter permease [Deltaproteobacteria bacterium]|nr:ABC transporter permease [Deltaproteobacteria bacterium]